MAQLIKQGDIFGRIGTGFGQGLAEQLPKEIERSRLASGLQSFEKDSANLSPMQQLARLSAIPGITPQMIQSFAELGRYQNQRRAFEGVQPDTRTPIATGVSEVDRAISDAMTNPVQQTPITKTGMQRTVANQVPQVPTQGQEVQRIVSEPLVSEQNLARPPWTPQKRNEAILQYMNQGFLPDQARQLASDDEARELAAPEAYQKRLDQLEEKRNKTRSELQRQLETKLQKTGEGVYQDITGEMLSNLERGLERDIILNPDKPYQELANKWSDLALNLAKTKSRVKTLAQTTGIETFIKGDENYKKLKSYSNIFKEAGNSEEYFNILRNDFGLSPQGAASVAFPLNKGLNGFLNDYKPKTRIVARFHPDAIDESKRLALEIPEYMGDNDSILSVIASLRNKYPFFNEQAFIDELNQNSESLRLNSRQKRELAEGKKNILPTWGDIKYLPWGKR